MAPKTVVCSHEVSRIILDEREPKNRMRMGSQVGIHRGGIEGEELIFKRKKSNLPNHN